MRTPPTLTRVDAVTLLGGLAPEQPIERARDGRCACVADTDGLWVVDLPSARVVNRIAVPEGMVSHRVLDDARLLVHDRAGWLRIFALPDGGEVVRFRAPTERPAQAFAAHVLVMPGEAELALRGGKMVVERPGALYTLIDLRSGQGRVVSAQRVADALMADAVQRRALIRWLDGPLDPWPEPSPDGAQLALAFALPPSLAAADDEPDWTHPVTLRVDAPDDTQRVWSAALEGYTMSWRGADALGGYVPVRTGPRPYAVCPFAVRRVPRDGPACTWFPEAPWTVRDGVVALGFTLDDGAMLAAFSAPRRAVTLRRSVDGALDVVDHLAGMSPESLDATRPVLIQAWSDGGVALALPRPNGDTELVVRGQPVATLPAGLGAPQHTFAPDRGLDLYYFTAGPRRTVRGVWLPP